MTTFLLRIVDYIDMTNSDDETYDPANPDHDDYFYYM
jgi:hypothetical protein